MSRRRLGEHRRWSQNGHNNGPSQRIKLLIEKGFRLREYLERLASAAQLPASQTSAEGALYSVRTGHEGPESGKYGKRIPGSHRFRVLKMMGRYNREE